MSAPGHTKPYVPELGQAFFGNPTGAFDCPEWVDALVLHLLHEIARVYWNREQRRWDERCDPTIPGIEFRPYWWGADDAPEAALPNFKHGDVEVRWYKSPGRGMSLNVPADPAVLIPWFESAFAAIDRHDDEVRDR